MLKIDMTVAYADGRTTEVKALPVSQVAFEREHHCSIIKIADEMMLSHIYWLAWHASRTTVAFDEWLVTVDAIDFNVDTPGPTQPAPPAD